MSLRWVLCGLTSEVKDALVPVCELNLQGFTEEGVNVTFDGGVLP